MNKSSQLYGITYDAMYSSAHDRGGEDLRYLFGWERRSGAGRDFPDIRCLIFNLKSELKYSVANCVEHANDRTPR